VQAAQLAHRVDSGAQVEVIGVAEENLHAQFFENVLRHCLHRTHGAHGHENWRLDFAMRSEQASQARGAGGLLYLELRGHRLRL
jgi:hypothetical protein